MPELHSRTFRFPKEEWYDLWTAHFEDLHALERALQKAWGRDPRWGPRVHCQLRASGTLDVTFIRLPHRDDALIESVLHVLRNECPVYKGLPCATCDFNSEPLPPTATVLDVMDHIFQEPT